jgi:hypothetical protein
MFNEGEVTEIISEMGWTELEKLLTEGEIAGGEIAEALIVIDNQEKKLSIRREIAETSPVIA